MNKIFFHLKSLTYEDPFILLTFILKYLLTNTIFYLKDKTGGEIAPHANFSLLPFSVYGTFHDQTEVSQLSKSRIELWYGSGSENVSGYFRSTV